VKAKVPSSHLPIQMATDNRLTTIYSTHVLIPKLGPIATQRYARLYAKLLKDVAQAVELVLAAQAYAGKYDNPVALPAAPPPANRRDFSFGPVLGAGDPYYTHYMVGLQSFASPKPHEIQRKAGRSPTGDIGAPAVTTASALRSSDRAASTKTLRQGLLDPEGNDIGKVRFAAAGVWPIEVTRTLRDTPQLEVAPSGRLIVDALAPRQYLADDALRERALKWLEPGAKLVDAKTVKKEVADSAAGLALAQILHGIAQPNAVLEDLLAAGAINATGRWLGTALAKARDVPAVIADIRAGSITKARAAGLRPLIVQALELLLGLGADGTHLLARLRAASSLRDKLFGYIAWRVDQLGALDPGLAPLPDDTVIVGSREWAFRRTERLSIGVGTPTLRGPIAAEAVAPASKLVLSESSVQEVVSFREQGSSRSRTRSSESASFSGATFRQALAHMAEEGINNEQAFSQQTTLFDSLRERRREAIERTLTQVSASNESRSSSATRTVSSQSRSYTTRGKDEVHATTEVAFQVAAPVDVQVRLEDVGLVWCPRLQSPFIALHKLIANHERQARSEYIVQNQVSDPARPPEDFETVMIGHQVGVRGNVPRQTVGFVIPVPPQYMDWTFDAAASKRSFRNGTPSDYEEAPFDGPWNWDDLENWHVEFISLQRVGAVILGAVTFETTDKEFLNHGFIVIEAAMKRLTEESRAAVAAYDLDRQEAAAQRLAVEVRANQYARLRRDELIEQYEDSLELQEEGFSVLVRTVFQGGNASHVSYWREILRSCIDWSAAGMRFEPADMNAMAYSHLPPSHFMNAQGIRFILPVHRAAEAAFFDALQGGAGSYFQEAATKVRAYVDGYRTIVEEAKANEPDKLVLDKYTSEIVLGRHLEAVLSEHPFAEPS
jgi:hypothetical protein